MLKAALINGFFSIFWNLQNAKSLGSSFGNAKDLSDIMTGSFKVQLINMGTRAAACKYATKVSKWQVTISLLFSIFFTVQAKLRALHEYHVRLLHNVLPAPSGVDIANNIKYFSQTLLSKSQLEKSLNSLN